MALLVDLVVLSSVLVLTAYVLSGWGQLGFKALGVKPSYRLSTIAIWLGFGILLSAIEFIHLFTALDWRVSLAIVCVGAIGQFAVKATDSLGWFQAASTLIKRNRLGTGIFFVVVVLWCFRAMSVPTMYDSGLYHFGSIRWLNEEPLVLGLGNLHWRLALNQSYFGFLAILNMAPYWGKGYAAGGVFLSILTVMTLVEVGQGQTRLWRWIIGGILFSYLCLLSGAIANPLPDSAVALIEIVIFLFLYQLFVEGIVDKDQRARVQVLVLVLCFAVVAIKLSGIAFAAISAAFVIAQQLFELKRLGLVIIKTIIFLLGCCLLHIVRGYLLSGAPLFPSPLGSMLTLPWAIPFGVAQFESELIYAWARQPGIVSLNDLAPGWGWFPAWFDAASKSVIGLFGLATLMAVFSLVFCFYVKPKQYKSSADFLYLPLFGALFFWFATAPDIRFLGSMLVLYAALASWRFAQTVQIALQANASNAYRAELTMIVVAGLVSSALVLRWGVFDAKVPPGWSEIPTVALKKQSTPLGLEIAVPQVGAQCWDAALPCAIGLNPGLRQYRIKGVMGDRLMFSMKEYEQYR